MKFETEIGLGEVVIITGLSEINCNRVDEGIHKRKQALPDDLLGKVIAIKIEKSNIEYCIEYEDNAGIKRKDWYSIDSLLPDPDFDHDLGGYPESETQLPAQKEG